MNERMTCIELRDRQCIFVQPFCSRAKKAYALGIKEAGLGTERRGKGRETKRDPFALQDQFIGTTNKNIPGKIRILAEQILIGRRMCLIIGYA